MTKSEQKLTKAELDRLKELMRKGNADPKKVSNDELFETLDLLHKAGATTMDLLGSMLRKSSDPTMRLLAEIVSSR